LQAKGSWAAEPGDKSKSCNRLQEGSLSFPDLALEGACESSTFSGMAPDPQRAVVFLQLHGPTKILLTEPA
jgi:hypothetical protein